MADDNLEERVRRLVLQTMEDRIQHLLSPVRFQLRAHSAQMAELANGRSQIASSVSRMDGVLEAIEKSRKSDHSEHTDQYESLTAKLDALLERLNTYVGMSQGRTQLTAEQAQASDRRLGRATNWARMILNASLLGGLYKGVSAAWNHWHHR